MEPLGTIPVYFPFLDHETREVLETTMNNAHDYCDFVKTLTEMILDKDCSDLIVYFVIHHSGLLLDYKAIKDIIEKYGDCPILRPNLLLASAYLGRPEDYEKVHEAADIILATDPDDWLALEMYFMKFEADMKAKEMQLKESLRGGKKK